MIATHDNPAPLTGPQLVRQFLDERTELTAVETFARHDPHINGANARLYRDLIPSHAPGEGQQYAFEVDLDACTGCKACVTACHSLNGLDADESWRDVGLLHGGTTELPVLQTVTTSCHHCLEPACLEGCPVEAYEKDPTTGIVKHLDDQCIGCQYCVLMCPYDVPKYNRARGIVRKCDMCTDRLAVGEAPACAQACPNQAIRISVVSQQHVVESAESGMFLPGAPDPSYTLPTTRFKSARALPHNLLPADHAAVEPSHTHWALVFMLVLTQLAVGAFLVEWLLHAAITNPQRPPAPLLHTMFALASGLVALGVSVLHLGRPLLAFRAIIGLRTSWLSREIVTFGLFALLAGVYAVVTWLQPVRTGLHGLLGGAVVVTGLAGVACSVMVYHCTRRAFWNGPVTAIKFFLTTVMLGVCTGLATSLFASAVEDGSMLREVMRTWGGDLCRVLIAATFFKLLVESSIFRHLRDRRRTAFQRTATLMTGALFAVTVRRFICGILGGILIPALLLADASLHPDQSADPYFLCVLAVLALGLTLAGELSERCLFFSAVVSPKMPGGVL